LPLQYPERPGRGRQSPPRKVSVALEIGSIGHFNALELEQAAGIDLNIVDGGTTSEKIPSLLGGKFDCMTATLPSISDYIASGEMKVLGLCRLSGFPNGIPFLPARSRHRPGLQQKLLCGGQQKHSRRDLRHHRTGSRQSPSKSRIHKRGMDKYAIAIQAVGREEGTREFKSQYEELKQFSDIFNKK
jgi:hypothetical protein